MRICLTAHEAWKINDNNNNLHKVSSTPNSFYLMKKISTEKIVSIFWSSLHTN